MKLILFYLIIALTAIAGPDVLAQETARIAITGKVLNADTREPIGSASLKVKGTLIAAVSAGDGSFTLEAAAGQLLLVSSVGYERTQIRIGKANTVEIRLKPSTSALDDIQIIAYGKTSKRTSTGNVATLKAADIARQPVSNPLLALAGRIPGLIVTQSTGFSGSGVNVQIQGQNSISATVSNDPLYLVDGVPYPSRLLWTNKVILGTSGPKSPTTLEGLKAGAGNPFSYINPNDIESIEVLKDADATAIYGSRAANGAILITTKKGLAGKTTVDFNVQHGVGEVDHMLDVLGTRAYLQMRHEAIKNSSSAITDYDYDLNGTWDTTRYTDWQKELIGRTARFTDAQGSLSGGNENTRFRLSTGYHRETTVFPGDFADTKGSVRFSMSHLSPNQKVRMQFSAAYLADKNQLPNKDITDLAVHLAPMAPNLYKANGDLNWAPDAFNASTWINPLSFLKNKYTITTGNTIGNAILGYTILPGLELSSNFGFVRLQVAEAELIPAISSAPEQRGVGTRAANFTTNTLTSWVAEPQLNYSLKFAKGRLDVLAGTTIQQNNVRLRSEYSSGYANDLVLESMNAAQTVSLIDGRSVYKYNAAFGRVNLNWAEKYLLNLTGRRDGSSRFGANNQFHNFGAVGAAWIFSQESLLKDHVSFLSFGKLRASYGTTGNDQISDYQYASLYKNTPVTYQNLPALAPANVANSYLQWEETTKLTAGLDLGFIKDRILVAASYYSNNSGNQLLNSTLPAMTGFELINGAFQQNTNVKVRNYGWEFSLNTVNMKSSRFSWSSNLNATVPRNKLLSFTGLESSSYSNVLTIGQPLTINKIYKSLGVDPATGLYRVADKDGNPTTFPNQTTDRILTVNTAPKFYGGFQNNIRYGNFELDFLWQFVKQISANYKFGSSPAGYYYGGIQDQNTGNQPVSVLLRWQRAGDLSEIPKYDNASDSRSWSIASGSDAGFSDGSYLRLKNASLSWWLPEKWMARMSVSRARIYAQGQNLITLTKYNGFDPEIPFLVGSAFTLPPLRMVTAGIQVSLQ